MDFSHQNSGNRCDHVRTLQDGYFLYFFANSLMDLQSPAKVEKTFGSDAEVESFVENCDLLFAS